MQNDVCAEFDTGSYFDIHLLKVESVSVLSENLSLRSAPTSVICDTTTTSEPVVVQYSTFTSVMLKLEAFSSQTLRMNFTVK